MNEQPIEKVDLREDGLLEIHSIFDTIQGECLFAGWPATFIRLSGCNIRCARCDTDYTSIREKMTVSMALQEIEKLPSRELVVFTGGEPLRQNIFPLCSELIRNGKQVQVETNGTVSGPFKDCVRPALMVEWLKVVCSPKTSVVDEHLSRKWIDAWKYVVRDGEIADDGLPITTLGQKMMVARPPAWNTAPIYIQPLDEGDKFRNELNTQAAVKSCQKFGYRLSIQTHKLVNLP